MTAAVIDVDEATFEQEVLARSREVAVVVDFWAAWCGPCRTLSPILEQLAQEAGGDWVLAKIDVDRNQMLAARFGVQGIPAVKAFRDGRVVAEFVGALPEQHVRTWLEGLGPTPADLAFDEGEHARARDDLAGAADAYRRALAERPAHEAARSALAQVELERRARTADETTLRERLARDPGDLDAAIRLADVEFARGEVESATGRLIDAVRRLADDERERARAHLVALLDSLPVDDPRALAARRALANALY